MIHSAHYELFVSSRLDEFETEYTIGQWRDDHSSMVHMETISIDHDALEIMVADADDVMDILSYLDITLVESPDSSDFIVEYESVAGGDYHSTYVRDVEEIVITGQGEDYLPTLNANSDSADYRDYLQGLFSDSYVYLGAGEGDLGDMYYVSTDQSLAGTTGSEGTVSGDIYYSGHHTDFDRNTSASSYGTAAALTGIIAIIQQMCGMVTQQSSLHSTIMALMVVNLRLR